MGSTAAESKINAAYVDGMPTNYDKYWALYNAIKSKGSIPIIRLKDFMKNANSIPVSYGGKTYNCNAAGAFEDNPYFYRKRFETALGFSQSYINRMKSDTASKSTQIGYYYADDSVPLYASACKSFY